MTSPPRIKVREILAVLLAKALVCAVAAWEELCGGGRIPCAMTLASTFLAMAFLIESCHPHHTEERCSLRNLPLALLPWLVFVAFTALPRVLSRAPFLCQEPSAEALATMGIVPYSEELLFRGIICAAAISRRGPVTGVLVSAFLFALDHSPRAMPNAFFAGIALGILFHRTGSLLLCVACHACQNAAAMLWRA